MINTPEQLTNRHIAKLINKLEPLNIPAIAFDAIKTEMFYLTKDILSISEKSKEKQNDREQNFNR